MALTLAGRELTDAHRIAQAQTAARWVALLKVLTGEIDPARIDATLPDFVALGAILAAYATRESQALGAGYLEAYRAAEGAPGGPIIAGPIDLAAPVGRMEILGPLAKQRISQGMGPQVAVDAAFDQIIGGFYLDFLAPGRDLLDASALANPASIGWRRVADTHPCACCAMLITRGPAYTSATNAGEGRRYHAFCGCTIEEVFGHWSPDAREQRMVDLYEQAAGGTAKDVLASMRANGQGVINDAHIPEGEKGSELVRTPGGGRRGGGRGGGGGERPIRRLPVDDDDPRRVSVQYSGVLGDGSPQYPLSAEELVREHQEKIASAEEPWLHFDSDNKRRGKPARPEESLAEWLHDSIGIRLLSVQEGRRRMPDAVLRDLSQTLELKAASSANSVEKAIRSARVQSRTVVVSSELDVDSARDVIVRCLAKWGKKLDEVLVVVDGGALCTLASMSTLYTSGADVDRVREAVAALIDEPLGYNVEEADEYPPYSIAIDLSAIYDAGYVAAFLQSRLGRPVATEGDVEAELAAAS